MIQLRIWQLYAHADFRQWRPVALFWLTLVFVPAPVLADEPWPLYLPIHSEQYPDIQDRLKKAIYTAGLTNIKVSTADLWSAYEQGIRRGRKGIYFAAPHFAAWVVHRHGFKPLLRLPDKFRFLLITRRANSHFFEMSDLANEAICTQRALNLDYFLLNTAFDNPVQSSKNVSVWSVHSELNEPVHGCSAFTVSDHAFIALDLERPSEFIRMQQGEQFNNYGFVLHPQLDTETEQRLKALLLRDDIQALLKPIYQLTSSKARLTEATPNDYPISYIDTLAPYWARKR